MFNRILILHLVFILPITAYNFIKWKKLKNLHYQQTLLIHLTQQVNSFSETESANNSIKKLYQNPSSNYLYSQLESLPLSNNSAKIQLIESPLPQTPFYLEKHETLAHVVQVDLKDLKTILQKIEGSPLENPSKPHLTFIEFSLKKNKCTNSILYDLNFKLLKREYS